MRINVDFEKLDTDRLTSEGIHEFTVAKLEETKSKEGKPMLKGELSVTSELDSNGNPKKVWVNFMLQDNAYWVLRQFANACGVYPGTEGLDTDSLLGRSGRAHILQQKGEGAYANKIQNVVQEYLPLA